MTQSTTLSLYELAQKYFQKKGYTTEPNMTLEGRTGISYRFDLIITKLNQQHAVQILNWRRTVGVNQIINFDKASADIGFKKPIVISEKFSSHAKAYANRKGITLLTKRELNTY